MNQIVTIFGGSGFLGRYMVRKLAKQGYVIKIACRNPGEADFLKVCGHVGQITPIRVNICNAESVMKTVEGSDIVINCVGILYPSGKQKFDTVHHIGAENIAKAVKKCGVQKFIHLSAIGANEKSEAVYAQTKAKGEKVILKHAPHAVILRPSVVFGPEDNFFNMFAGLVKITKMIPLIGGGQTKFQPVYVDDIAEATMKIIEKNIQGEIFELGGPSIYSFRTLMEILLQVTERKAFFVPMPYWFATIEATFLQLLPNPLLTVDQVKLLKYDNVVDQKGKTFEDLEIQPHAIELIMPTYLKRFRKTGQYCAE